MLTYCEALFHYVGVNGLMLTGCGSDIDVVEIALFLSVSC